MGKKDIVWGGILLALGAAIFVLIPGQIKNVKGSAVGPRAFPYFLAVLLMLCSAVLIIQGLGRQRKSRADGVSGAKTDETRESWKSVGFALGIFALLVLYAFVMRIIGYVPASLVFLMGMLYLLEVRKKRLYVLMIPIVLIVYAVFRMFLHVQLP